MGQPVFAMSHVVEPYGSVKSIFIQILCERNIPIACVCFNGGRVMARFNEKKKKERKKNDGDHYSYRVCNRMNPVDVWKEERDGTERVPVRVLPGEPYEGDFCSSLSLSRATDRSGRGIANSKSQSQPGTCILEFTIVGQPNGASPRRRECQSQANKTGRTGHVGVYNGWPLGASRFVWHRAAAAPNKRC